MSNVEFLIQDLPDPDSAKRFLDQFREKNPGESAKLQKDDALLSDILTLASYSPLLATTLLQNPSYVSWLGRQRQDSKVRGKEELLESLARFSLTNSQTELHVLFARFRRRELMRIFLGDIRRLATVAEITEDISNLADTILESALRQAKQELDNRFGSPLEIDNRGKKKPAELCIVSLGKLGSKELNYSSDIDLLFLYSAEGSTAGTGTRGTITNREYFTKLAEAIVKLVGEQTGEGAAYRVDLRLRPHGRVGALAMSVADTVEYYRTEARIWERQVLIRSRASAGDAGLFKEFFSEIEDRVFSKDVTVADALQNVRRSKQLIDEQNASARGFDVKLGKGGIREIEFIAQALQLAYGGKDKWLRAPHTLISLSRLAEHDLVTDRELNELSAAYEFLRRLEHLLQMEQGLQTHLLPDDQEKRASVAVRMGYENRELLEKEMIRNRTRVARAFERVFEGLEIKRPQKTTSVTKTSSAEPNVSGKISFGFTAIQESGVTANYVTSASDRFPALLFEALDQKDFSHRLSALRRVWRSQLHMIVNAETSEMISVRTSKRLQTSLAETAIATAMSITRDELSKRLAAKIKRFPLAILGLGKLGSANLDYESDLDVILVYDETIPAPDELTHAEFYSRAAEIFITALSGMTRDGNLYRVDLRLRPYGKNGPSVVSKRALLEYLQNNAAVWELLAYIKVRGVYSEGDFANVVESECTSAILTRAKQIPVDRLTSETREMRLRLERERKGSRRSGEVDIKYGSGGMLDIYFAIRYLQLRYGIADAPGRRSSGVALDRLLEHGSLSVENHTNLSAGYEFLSTFDHYLRLTVGRTTCLPLANTKALAVIADRMDLASVEGLLEQLTLHRLNIRSSFDNIVAH